MFKRGYRFGAALCLAALLLLSACASSVGTDEILPPEEDPSSSVPGNAGEGSESVPPPEVLPDPVPQAEDEPQPQPGPEDSKGEEEADPAPPAAEAQEEKAVNSSAEAPNVESVPESAPEEKRILTGSTVVPAQDKPVGDEYFDDAAFIGNSLVDGFRMFSGLKNCDYYAKTSMTIFGVGSYITQMSAKEYGKVYMLLGINEVAYNLDRLMQAYGKAVDRIKNDHPGAIVYVMGVSPVSAKKDASSNTFTMANIYRFNERLLQLAEDKNCGYIDLCDALGGEDGFLPADVTTDGVHFKASEYKVWLDYLRLHYIPADGAAEEPEPEPDESMTEPEIEPGEEPGTEPEEEPSTEPEEEPVPEMDPTAEEKV